MSKSRAQDSLLVFFQKLLLGQYQCLSKSNAQDSLLVFFQKLLLGQEPMLVEIKGSRLFVGFSFQKLLLGQEPILVHIKGSKLFVGFLLEVVARSGTNACQDQVLKTLCWFFFKSCC